MSSPLPTPASEANPPSTSSERQTQEQRDTRGRFAPGNKGGPGNPFARKSAALRQAVLDALTKEKIDAIVAVQIDKALKGDSAAAKLLLSYGVGKPASPVDPDTLDQHEFQILKGNHVADEQAFFDIVEQQPLRMMLALFNAVLPYLNQGKRDNFLKMWNRMGDKMDQKRAEREARKAQAAAGGQAQAEPRPQAPQPPPEKMEDMIARIKAESAALETQLYAQGVRPAPQPPKQPKASRPQAAPKAQPFPAGLDLAHREELLAALLALGEQQADSGEEHRPLPNGDNGAHDAAPPPA